MFAFQPPLPQSLASGAAEALKQERPSTSKSLMGFGKGKAHFFSRVR